MKNEQSQLGEEFGHMADKTEWAQCFIGSQIRADNPKNLVPLN